MERVNKNLKLISKTIKLIFNITGRNFYWVMLLTLFTGLSPVISVLLFQQLLNAIELKQSTLNQLSILLFIYLGFSLFSSWLSSISSYFNSKLRLLLEYKINYLIIEKSSLLSMKDFENSEVYNKLTRLENEVGYKPFQTFQALLGIISAAVTFISSAIILILWKPALIIILIILPFLSLYYYLKIAQEDFKIHFERSNSERQAWYISYLLTHDFSFKEIKMYGLKNYFLKRFWALKSRFRNQDNSINKKKMIYGFIFNTIQDICMGVVVFIAVISAFTGKLLIGNVATYIKSIGMIQSNGQAMVNNIYMLYESNLYMELLDEFLSLETEKVNSGEVTIGAINSIEFKNVSFSYSGTDESLKNISFSIKKGELVAIIGVNGSGKSTLLKLICGLYTHYKGLILINGIDLQMINKESYRKCIAVLFQDYLKYEFTLGDNVTLGDVDNINDTQKINKTLQLANVDFLKNSEESYRLDNQLGNWFDEGTQLSGGQWQKVAIARTYYRDASVFLLDEPSSALDAISEKRVFDSFFKLANDQISMFITHKVAVAKNAEKIIVINFGEIEGVGTHSELMSSSEVYRGLYQKDQIDSNVELVKNS
ncbi:ABC transporter ATP-binding protein [Alkalihalobacterium chitinilyticum]|uniref:ABC transporter ATP-binding protein/permease n=1 Tax=Alkalihalobacterium chitinilyticum TaxID=2980103 RepID=A0ABT5VIP6_9BACI|nr:ABC transporter ATP-binding protein [Alkalihalobacterium chitinilyticum]MDE5415299.1 ABC transporter ATP-binding protein/permease [Alkalihalobacterium chitinilyticum]